MNKILVVIDMQEDFVRGVLGSEAAQATIPVVANLVHGFQRRGDPIFYTRDTHGTDYTLTREGQYLPISHCIKYTEGWKICPEVIDYNYWNNIIIDKYSFGFENWKAFRDKIEKVDEIVICGLVTNICVVTNALLLHTFYPETNISVVSNGCAGTSKEEHDAAILTMKSCQINIIEK